MHSRSSTRELNTLGFLDAPEGQQWATENSFEVWSSRYILPSLKPVIGTLPTAVDLFGARCGILHTSSSSSRLGRQGVAREIWYEFRGKSAVNLSLNASGMPLLIDVDQFADTFRNGSVQFLADLKANDVRFVRAQDRTRQFFSWGVRSSPSG